MSRAEAIRAVVARHGASLLHEHTGSFWDSFVARFPSLAVADECKAVLDALAPGVCGAVFCEGRLAFTIPTEVSA